MSFDYSSIFKRGDVNPFGQYFTGTSYLNMLTTKGVVSANVTFEPGCRTNWHIHMAKEGGGQILLVTGGKGWYQAEGENARPLGAGDVVSIPQGVKHWHGAAADSWFSHVAVEVPGDEGGVEWLEAVTDEEYGSI